MPSLITVRGRKRYRGTVMVDGDRRDKLFPDASKKSFRDAAEWEKNKRAELVPEPETDIEAVLSAPKQLRIHP